MSVLQALNTMYLNVPQHVALLNATLICCAVAQSSDTEEVLVQGCRASLSDLAMAEDIEALSVRQLKEILARNFVNYKGCCEKWELMERVTRLYHDQKDLQNHLGKGGFTRNICNKWLFSIPAL